MKKKYIKPTMKVYELRHCTQLLVGSGDPDYWTRIPGIPGSGDEKHLA